MASETSQPGTERISTGSMIRYEDDEGELTSTVNEVADDGLLELDNGDAIPKDRVLECNLHTGTEQ